MSDNFKKKKISRAALIASDLLAVLLPALMIYTFSENINGVYRYRPITLIGIILFAFSILFCSQTVFEQYTVRRSFYDEFMELLQLYIFNGLSFLSSLFVFELSDERKKHLFFLILAFLLIPVFRYLTRKTLDFFGVWRIDCLIFSPQSEFEYAKSAIESQFNLGMSVRRSSLENRLLINLLNQNRDMENSRYSMIKEKINNYYLSIGRPHIIIFSHRKNAIHIPKIVDLLILFGFPYSIIPDVGGVSLLGSRVSHFFRWEVLLITPQNNIERGSYQILKRAIDLSGSIVALILFSLPMIAICLWIRKDGGKIIYKHKRIGRDGRVFECYKFRTMLVQADSMLAKYLESNSEARLEWQNHQKITNDPRITSAGRFLRATSLDELPQFFNVLIGDMSLVGPRPIVESERVKYGNNIEIYQKVRPGITGLWQISGRSNTTYSYRVALDIWYIKNWSIWYDLAILIKTIKVVGQRTGAY